MPSRQEQIEGAIWVLLVGDALGVPYEFSQPSEVPPDERIDFEPPTSFRRAHPGVPPGTWSDDGAQALCLLASLLRCGRLDLEDFMRRLANWYDSGYMAVEGRVFDVGVQTGVSLAAFGSGSRAADCGGRDAVSNGNGSLMRVLPLALWHRGSDDELVADASLQSVVTHAHLRAQLCCALYCLWARRVLNGVESAWSDAVSTLRRIVPDGSPSQAELEFHIRPDDAAPGTGTGYVVDCLRSARVAVGKGSYEAVVRSAIRLGHDTDTTACVAGGIAGLRDGVDGIPRRWRDALRGKELFVPLVEELTVLVR